MYEYFMSNNVRVFFSAICMLLWIKVYNQWPNFSVVISQLVWPIHLFEPCNRFLLAKT